MTLTEELFVIPNKKNYILYAPLAGSVLEVNSATIKLLQAIKKNEYKGDQEGIINELRNKEIIVDQQPTYVSKESTGNNDIKFDPTLVTLCPTTDCNLNCIYCFASAGDTHCNMYFDIAKGAIDFIVGNALKIGGRNIEIGFHGGGEPFVNFALMKEAVDYAKKITEKENLELKVSAATNGVLNKNMLEWIHENANHISVSLDGPEEIQNLQRPLRNGKKSFNKVMSTIEYFEKNNQKYSIRATITEYNVDKMSEMIDLLRKTTSLKEYNFEPVHERGRCKTTNTKSPDKKQFLENLIEAKKKASEYGINIYYSGGKLKTITNRFCGAAGRNFFVTPAGNVTSCLEVTTESDPMAKIFFYGRYTSGGRFEFDTERIDYLKSRVVDNIPYCTDCFAKFHCAGDCLVKVNSTGKNIFDTRYNERCYINKGILLYKINQKLDRKGGENENESE